MICTYAVHPPTQLYKKTTTPCAPPLQTEGPNFVSITAITYILQLPTTKKHPIIHIAARSILLYKTHSVSILTEISSMRSETTLSHQLGLIL